MRTLQFTHSLGLILFARELESVLKAHGLRLGLLDNLTDSFGMRLIHPEKVRRLQQSLVVTGNATTLNPTELEKVVQRCGFTTSEKKRLVLAVMATTVEKLIMDRTEDPHLALMAGNNVFRILLSAVSNTNPGWMAGVKGGTMQGGSGDGDALFERAMDLIDRGSLALHACEQATTPQSQAMHAHEAHEAFKHALEWLKESTMPAHDSSRWIDWHDDVVQQLVAVEALLRKLEGEQP